MVFESLVELHAWLHSYLYFSLLEKLFLKTSSTPPRHLAICRASKLFLIAISTPGGSIKKVPIPSIAYRHLVDRSSLISCVWCFCTSILARHLYLSTAKSSTLGSTPLNTFCRDLLRFYIFSSCILIPISLDVSHDSFVSSHPKPLSLTPNLPLVILQAFSSFPSLRKLLISFIYMHFMFWNLGLRVFLKNFGIFQNWWNFVEILG